MTKKKVFIHTTSGCTRRLLDASRMKSYCEQNNCQMTTNPEEADYIIINSCALHKITEDASVSAINRLKKFKGKMIVSGCLPVINKNKLKKVFKGVCFGPRNIEDIEKVILPIKTPFKDIADANHLYNTDLPNDLNNQNQK